VCIVDAGLITTLSDRDFSNFISLFATVAAGDGAEGARLMMVNAKEQSCPDLPAFQRDMQELYDRVGAKFAGHGEGKSEDYDGINDGDGGGVEVKEFTLKNLDIGKTLRDILEIVRKHHIVIESNFTAMMVAIVIIEGLGKNLDPNVNLVTAAVPYLIANMPKQAVHLIPGILMKYPQFSANIVTVEHSAVYSAFGLC